MHFRAYTATLLAAGWLGVTSAAQAQISPRLDSLNRGLSALSARIDSLEAGLCPADAELGLPRPSGDRGTDSLAARLQELQRRLAMLRKIRCTPEAGPAPAPAEPADSSHALAPNRSTRRPGLALWRKFWTSSPPRARYAAHNTDRTMH
jgi:hypothetical protein